MTAVGQSSRAASRKCWCTRLLGRDPATDGDGRHAKDGGGRRKLDQLLEGAVSRSAGLGGEEGTGSLGRECLQKVNEASWLPICRAYASVMLNPRTAIQLPSSPTRSSH